MVRETNYTRRTRSSGKENWIPISRRGNDQYGNIAWDSREAGCALFSHTVHVARRPTRRWTRLRNFPIATKAVQRKRSVVRFLPFGCASHFTLLQQVFPGYLVVKLRYTSQSVLQKSNEIDAFNSREQPIFKDRRSRVDAPSYFFRFFG